MITFFNQRFNAQSAEQQVIVKDYLRPQVREEDRWDYDLRKLNIRKNLVEKTVKKIF